MIAGAAALADAPAAHTGDDLLIGNLDGDHGVEADTGLLEGLGLGDRAGHAVQNVAVRAVRLLQALVDDADDDLIGHQLTGVHILLGLEARRSPILHGSTQNVASGDGRNIQLLLQNFGLSAFAGTRST